MPDELLYRRPPPFLAQGFRVFRHCNGLDGQVLCVLGERQPVNGSERSDILSRDPRRPVNICHIYAIIRAMKATIDTAGRIVVPKALRQALGLKPGQPLEIRAGDGRLEIEIAATPVTLKKRGKGLVAVPDQRLPALTAEQVRETLERVRR